MVTEYQARKLHHMVRRELKTMPAAAACKTAACLTVIVLLVMIESHAERTPDPNEPPRAAAVESIRQDEPAPALSRRDLGGDMRRVQVAKDAE